MSKPRNQDNFIFSATTRRQLARLKKTTGWTKKAVVEKAIARLAADFRNPTT